MPGTRKLGKPTAARMAMLRQQVTDLLDKGRMETTFTRAKEIQPLAEKMISLGKQKDMAAYRQALSFITREDVAHKVFNETAAKYATPASPASAPAAATPPRWPSSSSCEREINSESPRAMLGGFLHSRRPPYPASAGIWDFRIDGGPKLWCNISKGVFDLDYG